MSRLPAWKSRRTTASSKIDTYSFRRSINITGLYETNTIGYYAAQVWPSNRSCPSRTVSSRWSKRRPADGARRSRIPASQRLRLCAKSMLCTGCRTTSMTGKTRRLQAQGLHTVWSCSGRPPASAPAPHDRSHPAYAGPRLTPV